MRVGADDCITQCASTSRVVTHNVFITSPNLRFVENLIRILRILRILRPSLSQQEHHIGEAGIDGKDAGGLGVLVVP